MPTKTTEPVNIEPRFLVSRNTSYARLERLYTELNHRERFGGPHPAHASYDMTTPELVSQVVALARAFASQLEDEYHQKTTERARQESRQAALEELVSERVGKAS